jgi:hypothetical protein
MDEIPEDARKDLVESDIAWINAGRTEERSGLWMWRDEIEDPLK